MPNGPDVSETSTARGRATKVLPLTNCNAEWAGCQWAEHGVGGRLKSSYLRAAMPNGPDVSGMSTTRGGVTKILLLTSCNAEWARCQRGVHDEGWGH